MTISWRRGGGDGPLLLLLHGLGGSNRVWDGLVAELDPTWQWRAPDLPGHGGSTPADSGYSFGGLAAAVAADLDRGGPVAVLGHSLGGVVGLVLASGWFGVDVIGVCGLGIKVRWSDAEIAKATEIATRPVRVFHTREAAVDRALRIAGLGDLVAADSAVATSLVAESPDGWRLAMDPPAFGVGRPDLPGLLAAARAPVTLTAGEHDPMSPAEHLRELAPHPVVLPGLGHNAHVEDPAALVPLLELIH